MRTSEYSAVPVPASPSQTCVKPPRRIQAYHAMFNSPEDTNAVLIAEIINHPAAIYVEFVRLFDTLYPTILASCKEDITSGIYQHNRAVRQARKECAQYVLLTLDTITLTLEKVST